MTTRVKRRLKNVVLSVFIGNNKIEDMIIKSGTEERSNTAIMELSKPKVIVSEL